MAGAGRRARDTALTVVVPAWNEAGTIGACLQALDGGLRAWRPEIIVVDDGSHDGTAAVVAAWIAGHPASDAHLLATTHRGKGHAVYAGVRRSRGRAVALLDADLDIPASELARLCGLWRAGAAEVVVGSKRLWDHRTRARGPLRRGVSLACTLLGRVLLHLPVGDTQTGAKVFPGAWLRHVARLARVRGPLFDLELLGVAVATGLRVAEVPVALRQPPRARRLPLGQVLRACGECWLLGPSVRRITAGLRAPAAAHRVPRGRGRRRAARPAPPHGAPPVRGRCRA